MKSAKEYAQYVFEALTAADPSPPFALGAATLVLSQVFAECQREAIGTVADILIGKAAVMQAKADSMTGEGGFCWRCAAHELQRSAAAIRELVQP